MIRNLINQLFFTAIAVIIAIPSPIFAQQPFDDVTITGTVVNVEGEAVVGATVILKGHTGRGTATDVNGKYSITVPQGSTLIISFMGYEEKEVELQPDISDYLTTLNEAQTRINDVVIVGYGEIKKSDLTGSVSVVGERSFYDQPVKNVSEILQGRSSGVEVTTISGMPGASTKVRVRGTTSINKSSDPLYVIDGIISTSGLDGINPQDIASMQILKDASSTSVYGSRGANGVVLITTRSGQSGDARILFSTKIGVSDVRKNYNLLSPYEYALALNDIRGAGTISDEDVELYRLGIKGIDWVDLMTRTAITQDYNLSIAGGSEKVRYMVSGNLLDQEAITIDSKYMRYGLRANIEADVKPWLTLITKFNGSILHQKNGAPNWFHVLNYSPTMELKDPNSGIYNKDPYNILSNNPYGVIKETDSDSYSYNVNANAGLIFHIVKGLKLSVQGGYDFDYAPSYSFVSSRVASGATNSMSNASALHQYWQNTNNLTYSNTFGRHTLATTAVFELSRTTDTRMSISGSGLSNESGIGGVGSKGDFLPCGGCRGDVAVNI